MIPSARKHVPSLAIVVVLIAVVLAVGAICAESIGVFAKPRLVDDLETEWGDENSQFDRRLSQLLATGTSDDEVKSVLVREGLDLQGEQMAAKAWGWFPCRYYVQVYWDLDEQRRLTGIRGDYGASCT